MEFLIAALSFIGGTLVGSHVQRILYISQEWIIHRWNDESLGYRIVPDGTKIYKNQRVLMSLKLDTSDISEEGMKIE